MESEIVIKKIKIGDYFNEAAFYSDQPDDFSARAVGFATVYKIQRGTFIELIEQDEKDKETFN